MGNQKKLKKKKSNNNLNVFQEALTFELKGIHIVNTKPFVKEILDLIRPALNAKFVKIVSKCFFVFYYC